MAIIRQQPTFTHAHTHTSDELFSIYKSLNINEVRRLNWYHKQASARSSAINHGDASDLILVGKGLLSRSKLDKLLPTTLGLCVLNVHHECVLATKQPHEDLASRLAASLQDHSRLAWKDIELIGYEGRVCRPDVFSISATYSNLNFSTMSHEIKVSRADFASDMRKTYKWKAYLRFSNYLYYTCPKDLISINEVPDECGLIYETSSGIFEQVKRARKQSISLDHRDYMKLIMTARQVIR